MYYVGNGKLFRAKAFATPMDLWEAFSEYVQWAKNNPLFKHDVIKSGEDAGKVINIPADRPFTVDDFCLYVGISDRTFRNYGSGDSYIEYLPIYEQIQKTCRSQKFNGAAIGIYNANIIARDLGLVEKTETKHDGIPAIPPMLQVKVMDATDK